MSVEGFNGVFLRGVLHSNWCGGGGAKWKWIIRHLTTYHSIPLEHHGDHHINTINWRHHQRISKFSVQWELQWCSTVVYFKCITVTWIPTHRCPDGLSLYSLWKLRSRIIPESFFESKNGLNEVKTLQITRISYNL